MATSLLSTGVVVPSVKLPSVKTDSQNGKSLKCFGSRIKWIGVGPLCLSPKNVSMYAISKHAASLVCSAALNARCAAEQTQTIERQSTKITIAPIDNKEKSPELDDGGTGFPPRDDDGGGGGGGGGGWTGGFFFFGFLAFLGFLKDQENEGSYNNSRRR